MGAMSVLLNKLEILGLEMIGSFDPLTFCQKSVTNLWLQKIFLRVWEGKWLIKVKRIGMNRNQAINLAAKQCMGPLCQRGCLSESSELLMMSGHFKPGSSSHVWLRENLWLISQMWSDTLNLIQKQSANRVHRFLSASFGSCNYGYSWSFHMEFSDAKCLLTKNPLWN